MWEWMVSNFIRDKCNGLCSCRSYQWLWFSCGFIYFFCIFGILKKSQTAEKSVSVEARSSTCDINNYSVCDNSRWPEMSIISRPQPNLPGKGLFWRQEVKTRLNFLWVSIVSWYRNHSLSDRKKKITCPESKANLSLDLLYTTLALSSGSSTGII